MAPFTKRARAASDSDDDYRENSDDDFQGDQRSARLRTRAPRKRRVSARILDISKKREEQEAVKQATRQAREDDNKKQILLRLLGELRNIVYDLLITDEEVPLMHEPYLPEYINWEEAASGRALTQTCHELRAEFLPLYKRKTNVNVPLVDFAHYKDVWLKNVTGLQGRIVLSLKRNSHRNEIERGKGPRRTADPVNISRLLRLRRDNPSFTFFVESHYVVPPMQLPDNPKPPRANISFLEDDMGMIKTELKQVSDGLELQFHFYTKPDRHLNWLQADDLSVFLPGMRDNLHYWVRELMPGYVYRRNVSLCELAYHVPGYEHEEQDEDDEFID